LSPVYEKTIGIYAEKQNATATGPIKFKFRKTTFLKETLSFSEDIFRKFSLSLTNKIKIKMKNF
jgi:hypothetical protein